MAKKAAVAVHDPRQTASAPQQAANALAVIISAARDKDMPVEKLERLYAMQKEREEKEERIEFDEAMRSVQTEMGPLGRDSKGERGRYVKLEKIAKRAVPIYTKHGFSLSFGTKESNLPNHYRVVGIVAHKGGHSREYSADVPTDTTGPKGDPNKTGVQGFGSAMSYARRYLTTLIFNITIADEDDDGHGGQPSEAITDAQVKQLQTLAEQTGTPATRILTFVSTLAKEQVETLQDIPAKFFEQTVARMGSLPKAKK